MQAMLNKFFEFLSRDTSSISTTGFVLIILGAFLFVCLNIFFIKVCKNMVAYTGINSHSYIKLIMIALFPTIFNIAAVFKTVLPINLFFVLTAIMCLIVVIWNCVAYGILGGLIFSFLHIVGGISAGLLIAGFLFMIVVMIVVLFAAKPEVKKVGSISDTVSGETFDVLTDESGVPYINRGGERLLLHNYDSGRYYDDYGNIYML